MYPESSALQSQKDSPNTCWMDALDAAKLLIYGLPAKMEKESPKVR